ncbi:VWA domain-containing protein [Streptomyces sp. NPDC019890]|uniref:VWA domain-containing protein n=1 Tax=Streptomyces sp. NPDC019890 TaxID=3365064 RepID=UPI00384CF96D
MGAHAAAADSEFTPIDLAIAVDESSSLSATDVDRERDAAERIAVSEISAKSRLTVLGFASADDDRQSPVDEVCPTAVLSAAQREKLGDCVGRIDRRGEGQGTGTDFPAAIRQAVTRMTDHPTGGPRVLFLLTDGVLDVSSSPSYGKPGERESNGRTQLKEALAEAAAAEVQIWPLGFGKAEASALKQMAAGGYQGTCTNRPDAHPTSKLVPDAKAVGDAFQNAFAAARCLVPEDPRTGKPPTDIHLRLSPLATFATIVVSKGDSKVTATYIDPRGQQVKANTGDTLDGSTFQLTGADQEVESLQITAPRPGNWTVRLRAPENHRDQLATVGVQWRGQVGSSIVMTPASPRPGEQVTVDLRLQTRAGDAVSDPRDLARLKVSAQLTGTGFSPQPVNLADDGKAPDTKAGDGRFTGSLVIPLKATGHLKAEGVLGAVGLTADHRPFDSAIARPNPDVVANLSVHDATVHPGDRLGFTLKATNSSGSARSLTLEMLGVTRGDVRISPTSVPLPAGESTTVHGTIAIPAGERTHRVTGRFTVYDEAHREQPLDARLVTLDIVPPPSWPARLWQRWKWLIVTAAVLLACLVAYLVRRHRAVKEVTSVGGLTVVLLVPEGTEERATSTVVLGRRVKGAYTFDVVDPASADPRIEARSSGPYTLQRDKNGRAVLRTSDGEQQLTPGVSVPLVQDVRLRVDRGSAPPESDHDTGLTGTSGPDGDDGPDYSHASAAPGSDDL